MYKTFTPIILASTLIACASVPESDCTLVTSPGKITKAPNGAISISKTSIHALVCDPLIPTKSSHGTYSASYLARDVLPSERGIKD
jgi:hypothetical protein